MTAFACYRKQLHYSSLLYSPVLTRVKWYTLSLNYLKEKRTQAKQATVNSEEVSVFRDHSPVPAREPDPRGAPDRIATCWRDRRKNSKTENEGRASCLSEADGHRGRRRRRRCVCVRGGVERENETGGIGCSRSQLLWGPLHILRSPVFRSSAEWHFLDRCYTSAWTAAIVTPPRTASPPRDTDLWLFERKHLHFSYVWRFTMCKDNLALQN